MTAATTKKRRRKQPPPNAAETLRHPLRVRMLFVIEAGGEEGISPKELSQTFKTPLANVAYHVQVLRRARALDLLKKVPRRGAVEHYYVLSAHGEHLCGAARTLGFDEDGAA